MGIDEVKNYVVEKLKELLLLLDNFFGQFLGWFDKVFPPDTRKEKINHWFHVALPFLIVALIFAIVSYCCCRGRRDDDDDHVYEEIRMMKAPGRNCTMSRSTFESDPKFYFQNLRSYPGDYLV
ncbi:hypothetical protein HAX54_026911 [Datura stramonium]|uniref:Uncharacterized protein n=1 Tax=Datura stramonium TaxID=4076 RepID=A0ABS8V3U6_DATST|nr:hypothetical protein [Datura stramonium]